MMELIVNFPCFSIIMSLMGAVICSVLPKRGARALCTSLVTLGFLMSAATLFRGIVEDNSVTYMMGHYPAPWGNEIRFGTLEPTFTTLFSLVMLLCLLGGDRVLTQKTREDRRHLYYTMVLLIQAALFALCYTNDIFTGYVFIEICTIASCGILIIRGSGRAITAATRYMIFSLMGSGLFLLGVIMLYDITGHLLMPSIRQAMAELWATGEYRLPMKVTISLMVVGLAIKSGLFPFHFWMADTYGTALPGSAGMLSGIISKGYIVLLIKIIYSVLGTDVFYASGAQNVLFVFGVLGMIVGSVSAIRQADINRMVAFSSAAQIGYIYMGIGISPTAGMTAAAFHIITHALTKPALFLSASALSEVSGGSKKFSDLQGAGHRNRVAGVAFTISALSMIGVPSLIGFVSKLLFATAGVQAGNKLLPTLIALAISTVLNVMYFLRTVIRIYTPAVPAEDGAQPVTVTWNQQLVFSFVALVFMVLSFALGLHSQPVINLLEHGLQLLG